MTPITLSTENVCILYAHFTYMETHMDKAGTLFTRKPRGKKLTFLIGGPELDFALKCGVPSREWVYVWISFDGESRVEWCCVTK